MSNENLVRTIKDDYLKFTRRGSKEPDAEFLFILQKAEEEYELEPIRKFEIELNGNKRNAENQIYRRRLVDEDADMFLHVLKDNTFVVGLHLAYNNIGDKGAHAFGSLLQETQSLTTLTLSFNDIGPEGARAIARGIQMNETLRCLKLDGNKIQKKGGMAIAEALQVNSVLEELDLACTDLTTDCIIAFATVIREHPSLRSINLSRPLLFSLQEETTVHIANTLKLSRRLEEIHLGKHGIVNFGAERLAEGLMFNNTLLHLDLSGNRISRDGAFHLAKLLKQNTVLQLLNLSYNRIEDEGACYIADALAGNNNSLATLAICYNEIGEKGLCTLAEALYSNIGITQVYIWGNNLATAVCQAYKNLLEGVAPRLLLENTDIQPYVVDGIPYLARRDSPYAV